MFQQFHLLNLSHISTFSNSSTVFSPYSSIQPILLWPSGSVPSSSTFYPTNDFFTTPTPPRPSSSFHHHPLVSINHLFLTNLLFLQSIRPLQPVYLSTLIISMINLYLFIPLLIAFITPPITIPSNSIYFTSNSASLSPSSPIKLVFFPIETTSFSIPMAKWIICFRNSFHYLLTPHSDTSEYPWVDSFWWCQRRRNIWGWDSYSFLVSYLATVFLFLLFFFGSSLL